jgi:hypothetical protein
MIITSVVLLFSLQNAWAGAAQTGTDRPAAATASVKKHQKKTWIGAYGATGTQYHIFSANQYKGHKQNALAVFLERESGYWVPLPVETQRTYRWELRYMDISGTIEIEEVQVPEDKRTGGPYFVTLDHYQVALLCVRRWVFLPDYFLRPSIHLGLGFSMLDNPILEEGTRYNFNLIGGGGLEMDLSPSWTAYFDVRWEHYSNGGKMGLCDAAVIGPESINAVLGIRYAWGK